MEGGKEERRGKEREYRDNRGEDGRERTRARACEKTRDSPTSLAVSPMMEGSIGITGSHHKDWITKVKREPLKGMR